MLNDRPKKTVGIVGLGKMGTGLLRLFLSNKFNLIAFARKAESLSPLAKKYESYIDDGSLVLTNEIGSLKIAEVIIETISEDFESKKTLFSELSNIVNEDCIICTNTSSLSITKLSHYIKNPSRFLGLHFFNPPSLIKVAEIIPYHETSQEILDTILEILNSMDFKSIILKDSPGFLTNRLLFGLIVQAIRYHEENKELSPQSIDNMMEVACNFKMGPLKTADLIGLDTCLIILKNLEVSLMTDAYKPPKLLEDLVLQGNMGKKSGRGFYDYN